MRSPTARLFVAVDPSEDIREALAGWARSALRGKRGAPLRILDPELLHVTLCFLGNRPLAEMDYLAEQLSACGGPPGQLSVGAPLWLPERNPRALAVELHDDGGRLAALQIEVVAALQEVSGWQPNGAGHTSTGDKRGHPFHPHITVARLRRGAAPPERTLPPTPSLSFVAAELVLYRSWLSPEGASYEAIATHSIG